MPVLRWMGRTGCIGSNKGGVAKEHPYSFTEEDFAYIKGFDLVYTNLNAYIEEELSAVASCGVPVAFDFSLRWTDEYLKQICPHIQIALMSCAHLDDKTREAEMKKAADLGVPIVLGTIGEEGSWLLYRGIYYYAKAVKAENVIDTMGAGDCAQAQRFGADQSGWQRGSVRCAGRGNESRRGLCRRGVL